ncbi:MAG: cation:proton antiporter [Candidatus Omnitrophica bacterium]|nr:cation:proton antiporter [Candidatus Omnitrophota bacterium]
MLFLLGLALFGGTIGGRLFQKLKIPQVVGYIAIGLAIGESGLGMVDQSVVSALQPFNYFALGLIGFMVGGELKKEVFSKYGRQMMTILFCEGIGPFLLVSLLIGFAGLFLFGDWRMSFAMALLFGAIASATDPATTTEVLREYKTRGPLTRSILAIVALDDGLALLLFVIASSIAGALIGKVNTTFWTAFLWPLYEVGGAIMVGCLSGLGLISILKKYSEEARLLAFSVGIVLLVAGLSLAIHVDMLLAVMTLGVIATNYSPRKSKDVFKLVGAFTPPIYVLFFVLVGAKLNLGQMVPSTVLLVGIYVVGTMLGKTFGARFGARISGAPKTVQRYLPLGLFSQAGVAIGLSILAAQYFPGDIGNTIVIVITGTTFILQLVGPALTKLAMIKAKEVGLNISEEDLMDKTLAAEVMDKNPPLIYKNTPLAEILNIFSASDNSHYPVVDKNKKLLGIISIDNIRNIFMATGLNDLLLAVDFMEPPVDSVRPESLLLSVKELIDRYNLEYVPVTNNAGVMEGFIERRSLKKFISTKVIELQRQVDSLENAS